MYKCSGYENSSYARKRYLRSFEYLPYRSYKGFSQRSWHYVIWSPPRVMEAGDVWCGGWQESTEDCWMGLSGSRPVRSAKIELMTIFLHIHYYIKAGR